MERMGRRAIGAFAAAIVVAASLWTPTLAQPTPLNNIGLRTIPFRVINNTGRSGNLFLYVVGEVPSRGSKSFYLSNVNGDVTIVPQAAPPGVSLGLNLGTAETTDVNLPQLTAARIFFSIGQGLLVTANKAGDPPSSPPGWVPGDPNFLTYFDFAEFTWNDDPAPSKFVSTLGGNATQVDMFGMTMLLALTGSDDDGNVITRRAGFRGATTRKNIFQDLENAGRPWNQLIMGRGRAVPLRVIAPYHGIEAGLFPENQLRSYINQVWTKYTTKTIVGQSQNRTYEGSVVNDELVFNQIDGPGSDPPFKFVKPTTFHAYQNFMLPIPNPDTPEGDRARAIGALLGAAFMRTTLLANRNLNACKVAQFYVNAPVNVYARLFHLYGLNRLAYSFGFDDTCDQSSFIQIHDPQSLKVTLGKF